MKTRTIGLTIGVGMLILVVFQQISIAQQENDSEESASFILAADSANGDDGPFSAAQDSVLIPAEDEGACSIVCEDDCFEDDCRKNDCCKSCSCCVCRCTPTWRFFGDFLYLRPRNAEVTYAVPFDGPVAPGDVPIQVGQIGIVDPGYEPAFRVGFDRAISDCASLGATYTQLDSTISDSISVDAPIVIRSMVIHPSTANAETDWLSAEATYDVRFKLVDLDYRRVFLCGDRYSVNYLIGARYGRLEQVFQSTFTETGSETINTNINFDGGGIRVGLEGERHARCSGFLVYGKSTANFVAGEFRARYFQGNSFDPEIVDTSWKAGRIMSILDLELGVGWASRCDRVRITGGYMVSAWYNVVTTADFIGAVQRNDFTELGNTELGGKLTFDGLVVRAEFRY